MNIIFCRSNPIHPDPRVEKEARCLQAQGHSVTILGWDRSGELPRQETTGGLCIYRQRIKAGYAHGLGNLFPLLRWQISLIGWLIRHASAYDAIHACDFDTVLPALLCAKLLKKKIVYDIFDFYADHLRATPGWIKDLIRGVDRWVIDQVDAVILVDDARLVQIAGTKPARLVIINNTPEDYGNSLQPRKRMDGDAFRIAYIGLMQVERGLLHLIEVLRKHPEWALDLAGFGGDEEWLLESARGAGNIAWHGRIDYRTALELESAADVLVALYDPKIANHRYASPNKVFEAFMLGKPVIVARNTNVDRIVSASQSGLVIEYGDASELDNALHRLAEDQDFRKELGLRARQAYEKEYNWDIMRRRLIELYSQI